MSGDTLTDELLSLGRGKIMVTLERADAVELRAACWKAAVRIAELEHENGLLRGTVAALKSQLAEEW